MANASKRKCSNEIFHSHVENPHDVSHPCRREYLSTEKNLFVARNENKNKRHWIVDTRIGEANYRKQTLEELHCARNVINNKSTWAANVMRCNDRA